METQDRAVVFQVACGVDDRARGMQLPPLGSDWLALMSMIGPVHLERTSTGSHAPGCSVTDAQPPSEVLHNELLAKEIATGEHCTPVAPWHEQLQLEGPAFRPL